MPIHIDIGLPWIINSRDVYGVNNWITVRMESLILHNEIPCHGSGNASCGRKCYVEQRIKKLNDEQKNNFQ